MCGDNSVGSWSFPQKGNLQEVPSFASVSYIIGECSHQLEYRDPLYDNRFPKGEWMGSAKLEKEVIDPGARGAPSEATPNGPKGNRLRSRPKETI